MGYYTRHTLKVYPPLGEGWIGPEGQREPFQIPYKTSSGYKGFPKEYEAMANLVVSCKEAGIEVPAKARSFFGLYPLCRIILAIEMKYEGTQFAILSGERSSQYDWEGELKELSQEFPDCVFELDGDGEESGDVWRAYFKNGKMQKAPAKIVFDPFDETKLS